MLMSVIMSEENPKENILGPRIAVVGVGGAGSNAVDNMIRAGLTGVTFLVCNTDAQALNQSLCPESQRLRLGFGVTQGLGAGSCPEVGRAAGEESIEEIIAHLKGIHMIFVTAGMGGGTGTGASPVICKAAREQGILTVGVVTKPFHFEGTQRMRVAERGIETIRECVDTLLVIPNQNLFRLATQNTTFIQAFMMADEVLNSGVRTFTDLMLKPGLVNCDFADICTVMRNMKGKAMMGTGEAKGEQRATEAAEKAIGCLLLDDVSIHGAKAVLINITGGMDLTLYDVDEAIGRIKQELEDKEIPGREPTHIIFGATFDKDMSDVLRVSVVATGIEDTPVRPSFTIPNAGDFSQNFASALQGANGGSSSLSGKPSSTGESFTSESSQESPRKPSLQDQKINHEETIAGFGHFHQKPVSYNTLGSRHGDYNFNTEATTQGFSLQDSATAASFGHGLYGGSSEALSALSQNFTTSDTSSSSSNNDFFLKKKDTKEESKINKSFAPQQQETSQEKTSWFDRFLRRKPMEKTQTSSSENQHSFSSQQNTASFHNKTPGGKFSTFSSAQNFQEDPKNSSFSPLNSHGASNNTSQDYSSSFGFPKNDNKDLGQKNSFSSVYYPQDHFEKNQEKFYDVKGSKNYSPYHEEGSLKEGENFSGKNPFPHHNANGHHNLHNHNNNYGSSLFSDKKNNNTPLSSVEENSLPSFLRNRSKETPPFGTRPSPKKK